MTQKNGNIGIFLGNLGIFWELLTKLQLAMLVGGGVRIVNA
jgi:hypothetical protein